MKNCFPVAKATQRLKAKKLLKNLKTSGLKKKGAEKS